VKKSSAIKTKQNLKKLKQKTDNGTVKKPKVYLYFQRNCAYTKESILKTSSIWHHFGMQHPGCTVQMPDQNKWNKIKASPTNHLIMCH